MGPGSLRGILEEIDPESHSQDDDEFVADIIRHNGYNSKGFQDVSIDWKAGLRTKLLASIAPSLGTVGDLTTWASDKAQVLPQAHMRLATDGGPSHMDEGRRSLPSLTTIIESQGEDVKRAGAAPGSKRSSSPKKKRSSQGGSSTSPPGSHMPPRDAQKPASSNRLKT